MCVWACAYIGVQEASAPGSLSYQVNSEAFVLTTITTRLDTAAVT